MPAGGARTPSNPAPVSGPGALSRRTDGGPGQPIRDPGGLPYGDNAELRSVQGAAPMSGQSPVAALGSGGVPLQAMSPNLFDPTDDPNEPITAGAPFGPGPNGPANAAMPKGPTQERLIGALPTMLRMAESPYVSAEFKALANYIRASING